jgi:hypothetical protein
MKIDRTDCNLLEELNYDNNFLMMQLEMKVVVALVVDGLAIDVDSVMFASVSYIVKYYNGLVNYEMIMEID